MAIYHLHAKIITRATGQSAVASAAYRRAAQLFDERYDKAHDYTKKQAVIHSELSIPKNSPPWLRELQTLHETDSRLAAEKLWNFVEAAENRKDAQLAREIEFSLPLELSKVQNIQLAREFILDQFVLRGMIADWNVHWDQGNPHVHVMLTMRSITENGFGQKVREWNQVSLLEDWRGQWAEYANFHLKLHGHDVRIDHRSYAEQGIPLLPIPNQSLACIEMERKGISTVSREKANEARRENLVRIIVNPDVLLTKIASEKSTFTSEEIAQELGRYINDQGKFSVREIDTLSKSKPLILDEIEQPQQPTILTPATLTKIVQGIENHDSVFSEREIAKALLPYTDHADLLVEAIAKLKKSHEIIPLGAGDDGRDRYTTRRLFDLENKLQHIVDDLKNRAFHKMSVNYVLNCLAQYEAKHEKVLTTEQRLAIQHITRPHALSCLVGRAGTGKSFLLGAAKSIWEKKGYSVLGVALSGIAADGLEKSANIPSQTIESFRYALKEEWLHLTSKHVIVMDEAGMTDTPAMVDVLTAVQQAKAKLVLVGDPAQIQPVGAGASFRAILERTGFAEIKTVYRQRHEWQREATQLLSKGEVKEALQVYQANGCVHLEKDQALTFDRLVTDWFRAREATPKPLSEFLVITHRNEDVKLLNHRLRAARLAQNEIEKGFSVNTHMGSIQVAAGERILFLKNDKAMGVSNGRFATIESVNVDDDGRIRDFSAKLDGSDKVVIINPHRYKHFDYGYAATVHKVQGVTVDHAFVLANGHGWNRHLTYVAKTRHRESCHLYASHEIYQDMEALQKGLGRYGMKDSVLDFPLAFAARRGIETDGLSGKLQQHLTQRLQILKITIADRVQAIISPSAYYERQTIKANEKIAQYEQFERREDARLVAQYVDCNRAIGVKWEDLQASLKRLGLKNLSYQSESFTLISKTKNYIDFQANIQERNRLSDLIVKESARYEKAMDIYGLDVNKLKREALQHQKRERVREYQHFLHVGKAVYRDQAAAHLMGDIKAHYPIIKAFDVDIKKLREHAIQHEKRLLFKNLSHDQKQGFLLVENYLMISKKAGQFYHSHFKSMTPGSPIERVLYEQLMKMHQDREEIAAEILEKRELCDKALDFYQIGLVKPHFDEKVTETLIQAAQKKWYHLQQTAARFQSRQLIESYHTTLLTGDENKRKALANQIIQDVRGHHSAVKARQTDTKALWGVIRSDARAFARDALFSLLSKEQQTDFRLVENFIKERQKVAISWSEIISSQTSSTISPEKVQEALMPLVNAPTVARDRLALAIQKNIERFTPALYFYNLEPGKLTKPANSARCRERVAAFKDETHFLEKGKLAQAIFEEPKAHHGALLAQSIRWQDMYRYKNAANQKALFAELSIAEKAFYRLAKRYQAINRQNGKTWARLLSSSNDKKNSIHVKQQDKATVLLAKRDYVAHQLLHKKRELAFSQISLTESMDFYTQPGFPKIDWKKVETQATKHADRLEQVTVWKHHQSIVLQMLPQMLQQKYMTEALNMDLFLDWQTLRHDVEMQLKPLYQKPHSFRYALLEKGILQKSFLTIENAQQTLIHVLEAMEKETPVKTIDASIIKRIQRARDIERGSRPIHNTLAERYLREHRGIQGQLSDSLRFHPGVYHREVKQKLPALIAITKNNQHQTQAIQVIYLDRETGNKAKLISTKLTYGSLSQDNIGVVISEGKNHKTLAVAEGIETALSIREADPNLRIIAVLGSSNFARVPISSETEHVLFCADNDGVNSSSQKKIKSAAEKLAAHGITISQIMPKEAKQDFNDVLKARGKVAVQEYLKSPDVIAEPIEKHQLLNTLQKQLDKSLIDEKHKFSQMPQLSQLEKNINEKRIEVDSRNHLKEIPNKTKVSITSEQEKRYQRIVMRYKVYKLKRDQNRQEASCQTALERYASKMAKHPELLQYLTQFPNVRQNILTLSQKYHQKLIFSFKEESEFKQYIKHYQKLKQDRDLNNLPMLTYQLNAYSIEMRKNEKLMHYIDKNFPRMGKNIKTLSQRCSFERDLIQEI